MLRQFRSVDPESIYSLAAQERLTELRAMANFTPAEAAARGAQA